MEDAETIIVIGKEELHTTVGNGYCSFQGTANLRFVVRRGITVWSLFAIVAGNHKIADPLGKAPLIGKLDGYQQDKYTRIQDGEADNPG
jgi:hypothetical protein